MPVLVSCPVCSISLRAPDAAIGQHLACPRCNAQVPVQVPTQVTNSANERPVQKTSAQTAEPRQNYTGMPSKAPRQGNKSDNKPTNPAQRDQFTVRTLSTPTPTQVSSNGCLVTLAALCFIVAVVGIVYLLTKA